MEKGSITYKPADKPPQSDEKSYLLSKDQVVKSSGFGGKTMYVLIILIFLCFIEYIGKMPQ
jgi:hypothetical protein